MRTTFLAIVTFAAVACSAIQAKAEKAPQRLSALRQSDLIVVGTITQIRVESERSRVERAFGNYDWGIYVTLAIEEVEKGQQADSEMEFRCFRVKSRRSSMEYLSPSGHRPIPGVGTRVRAYLNGEMASWSAALPNGITPPDANDDESVWPDGRLADAAEIRELRGRTYTYILPLEVWGFLVLVVAPTTIGAAFFIRRRKRRRTEERNAMEQTDEP